MFNFFRLVKTMNRLKITVLLLISSLSVLFGQQAVLISQISEDTSINALFFQLYYPLPTPAPAINIGGCQFSAYDGSKTNIYTIPTGTMMAPQSTFLVVCTNNKASVLNAYSNLDYAPNVVFTTTFINGGPIYFLNAQGSVLDWNIPGRFIRTSAVLDALNNLIPLSGQYITTNVTPSPLVVNVLIKRQSALLYGYNVSGCRTSRTFNSAYQSVKLAPSHLEEDSTQISQNYPTNNLEKDLQITVYPNPIVKELNIKLTGELNATINYSLYNLSGGVLLSGEISCIGEHPIPMSQYKSGIYILEVDNGKEKEIYKIIKEH
jgi:hypothetical protein